MLFHSSFRHISKNKAGEKAANSPLQVKIHCASHCEEKYFAQHFKDDNR